MCLSRTGTRWISVLVSKWSVFQNTVTDVFHVCHSNASDMEFRFSIALGNEMDITSLTLLISKQRLFRFVSKS